MKILDHKKIERKIQRLSYQIIEANFDAESLYLLGINNNGYRFAELLRDAIMQITEIKINLHRLNINPAAPVSNERSVDIELDMLKGKRILIVDDVANTGRTMFYAFKPFMDVLSQKIEVAVLVDRKHKAFPIKVDYVGTSLATTIKENIRVKLEDGNYEVVMK